MNDQEGLKETFHREVQEIFDGLDVDLVDLEKNPNDSELLNTIFRHIHTLKGSWALFGYEALERFTHLQEDLLGHLRSENIPPTVDMVDVLFDSFDCMRENFEKVKSGEDITDEPFMETSMKIVALLPEKNINDIEDAVVESKRAEDAGIDRDFVGLIAAKHGEEVSACAGEGMRLYQIKIMLDSECFKAGVDPLVILKRLGDVGKVIKTNSAGDMPPIKDFDPTLLYFTSFLVFYASKLGLDEINEMLEFALDNGHVTLHQFTPGELQKEFAIEADPFWTDDAAADVQRPSASLESIEHFKGEVENAINGVKGRLSSLTDSVGDELLSDIESLHHFFRNINENSGALELDELSLIALPIEERLKESLAESDIEEVTFSSEEVLGFSYGVDRIKEILVDHAEKALKSFVEGGGTLGEGGRSFMLGELLIELGVMTREDLDKVLMIQEELKEAVKAGYTPDEVLHPLESDKKAAIKKARVALRVDPVRLDNLVDLVGELVIAQSLVTQDTSIVELADAKLDKNIAQLTRITSAIQDVVMSMRMLPLTQTFKKMSRVVRDVSKQLGKEVQLTLRGEETEVDKSVIDEIGDPLIHLLRNCVDHGIEAPELRAATGKSTVGKVSLSAFHQGGNVVIEVSDDGRGLSKSALLKSGIEKGLLKKDVNLTDSQIYGVIFEPGFSTAKEVTKISGRGVGLDAVKKGVESLRGKIDVSSEEGKGVTFSIKLPLTLAIIEGMLVRIGADRYIIPTLSVESSFRPESKDITMIDSKGEMVKVRDKFYPLLRMHEFYGIEGANEDPAQSILVLVESDGRRCCMMIDEIIGHQHIVIKSLGDSFRGLKGLSGCTILGDGRVGLIFDIGGLIDITIG